MGTVNAINPAVDITVRVFDEFYDFAVEVDANTWDIVNSYMLSVFKTADAAENFSTTLFRIADETRVPVLDLLAQIEGMDTIQLTATLAYFLNGLRSPATLLGVNEPVTPNSYVARNVLP
jgi:pyruvate/2-oxoacid:ferredoxin oxidoreductase alpha subunit